MTLAIGLRQVRHWKAFLVTRHRQRFDWSLPGPWQFPCEGRRARQEFRARWRLME